MASRLRVVALNFFLGVLVCVSFGERPIAQVQTPGVIGGTVYDAVGVVPGATVTLVRDDGIARTTTTNDVGVFRFASVSPGRYVVKIEMQGFKPLTIETFTLQPGELRTFSKLVLQAGSTTETVSVIAQVTPVQVSSSSRQQGITNDQISNVTMPGRDIYGFLTTPGVQDGNLGRSSQQWNSAQTITINGVPVANGTVTIDGRPNTASYAPIVPNPFTLTQTDALSTFAADVDTASYTNVRRFLREGQLPPPNAVRIEELINYFRFDYPEPVGRAPVSISTEVGECPWAPGHQLALVGVRARSSDVRQIRPRAIVLLLDVSGSMAPPDRLPLIKSALRMFADTLRQDDRLAIVVYAGASGLVLPSTPGSERTRIREAIEGLNAGGSTNGAAGIVLAYQVARQQFVEGGINRVILGTDGDFNVGVTAQTDLVRLIEREKQDGIFLSVLGVGRDNLKDSTMEMLADKGNGNYAYLDSLQEARRVLVAEGGATLETVAKDVKFQVEFNPARVGAWRLIGYEDRLLARQDFNDDRKDGGELGAGHTVTALYEIVPAGSPFPDGAVPDSGTPPVNPLIYQTSARPLVSASPDLLTVKIRYKLPDGADSALLTRALRAGGPAPHVAFAGAVAEFGQLLRDSYADPARWDALEQRVSLLPAAVNPSDQNDFATLVSLARDMRHPVAMGLRR